MVDGSGPVLRPYSEWSEDHGDVLWWRFPVTEPPYVGGPNDLGCTVELHAHRGLVARGYVGGWPFMEEDEPNLYWTPLVVPDDPRALPDGLFERDGVVMFACRVCGRDSEWPTDIEDFVFDAPQNVCGGSPRCCP